MLIDEATDLMGLDENKAGAAKVFARGVLNIEISGPGRPQL